MLDEKMDAVYRSLFALRSLAGASMQPNILFIFADDMSCEMMGKACVTSRSLLKMI